MARIWLALPLIGALLLAYFALRPAQGCCPAPRRGQPVVNADQTVILIWDAATKTEHFIRQASFKSEAEDFGFLVPSPSRPELDESGNEAFGFLSRTGAECSISRFTLARRRRRQCGAPCIGCLTGCASTHAEGRA